MKKELRTRDCTLKLIAGRECIPQSVTVFYTDTIVRSKSGKVLHTTTLSERFTLFLIYLDVKKYLKRSRGG